MSQWSYQQARELSTGTCAESKESGREKRHSPLDPLWRKGKGKETRRRFLWNAPRPRGRACAREAAAGSGGITRNELTRKTQFIRKSFRGEYLADLIESGELVMTTGTRGLETYKIGI